MKIYVFDNAHKKFKLEIFGSINERSPSLALCHGILKDGDLHIWHSH